MATPGELLLTIQRNQQEQLSKAH